jgi:hypothetical protein
MTMPRSIQEVLDYADELATRFEDHDPQPGAAIARARSERQIVEAVTAARSTGLSWQRIGGLLGPPPRAPSSATATSGLARV